MNLNSGFGFTGVGACVYVCVQLNAVHILPVVFVGARVCAFVNVGCVRTFTCVRVRVCTCVCVYTCVCLCVCVAQTMFAARRSSCLVFGVKRAVDVESSGLIPLGACV